MKKVKNWWMPMVWGALLIANLAGVAGATLNDMPFAALTRRITVPAGHFIPGDDSVNWVNQGSYLISMDDATTNCFKAPVVFPTGQAVVVEKVTLYAYDYNTSYGVSLVLRKTDPRYGSGVTMANIVGTGSGPTDPRTFTDKTIVHNPVKHGSGVYLSLCFTDDSDLKFYGVRIEYHHGTT
jgi:hypothetical protein